MLKNRYTTQACQIGVTNLGYAGEPAGDLPAGYNGITALQRFQNQVLGNGLSVGADYGRQQRHGYAYNAP